MSVSTKKNYLSLHTTSIILFYVTFMERLNPEARPLGLGT